MAKRKLIRDDLSIESISTQVSRELAANSAARQEENRRSDEEKRKREEAERRSKERARIEPEYNAVLKAISDLERDILQMDYEIRACHEALSDKGRESGLKKLQALIDRRRNRIDELHSKRHSRERLKSMFE